MDGNIIELAEDVTFHNSKVKSYKINDHGATDISNTDINLIDVNKYKNYTYTPRQ